MDHHLDGVGTGDAANGFDCGRVVVLGDVVGDRSRRVALGAGARAVMEQRYGLDVVADSLAALYESLAGSRRS